MQISATTPDEHLASFADDDVREAMRTLDALATTAFPDRRRVLWEGTFWGGSDQSIIGYGRLVQPRPKGDPVEWFVAGLARQKAGFSLYVNAVEDGAYLGKAYADRLGKVRLGAASIGFRRLEDVDLDVLAELLAHAHRASPADDEA